jgi:hypothetical protein
MNPNPAAGGGSCWTGEPYLCPDGCNTLLVPRETKGGPARDLGELAKLFPEARAMIFERMDSVDAVGLKTNKLTAAATKTASSTTIQKLQYLMRTRHAQQQ